MYTGKYLSDLFEEEDELSLVEFMDRISNSIYLPLDTLNDFTKEFIFEPNSYSNSKVEEIKAIISELPKVNFNCEYLKHESYSSTKIEGARTTIAETVQLLEGKRASNESQKMTANSIKAIEYTRNNKIPYNKNGILTVWNLVMGNTEFIEDYRKESVVVGTDSTVIYRAPDIDRIEYMMDQLFYFINEVEYEPLIKAPIIHFYFVYIHPFKDGNGRTARILLTDYLKRNGYPIFGEVSVSSSLLDNLSEYYNTIEKSEHKFIHDVTPFVNYYLDTISRSLKKAIQRDKIELNTTQKDILKILESNYRKSKVSGPNSIKKVVDNKEQARIELQELEEKGFIKSNNFGQYNINDFRD